MRPRTAHANNHATHSRSHLRATVTHPRIPSRASRKEVIKKAVEFHGIGEIRLEEVPEPRIEQPTDAIVRLTASAICGTALHFVRGTVPGMKAGTILGHEGVGVVEELGDEVRNVRVGDRVVIPSTIACKNNTKSRTGYYS